MKRFFFSLPRRLIVKSREKVDAVLLADRQARSRTAAGVGLRLDRPANPEAVFDCWKRAAIDPLESPSPPPGAERVGVRWGIPERSPIPTSPSQRCALGPTLSALKGGEGISTADPDLLQRFRTI